MKMCVKMNTSVCWQHRSLRRCVHTKSLADAHRFVVRECGARCRCAHARLARLACLERPARPAQRVAAPLCRDALPTDLAQRPHTAAPPQLAACSWRSLHSWCSLYMWCPRYVWCPLLRCTSLRRSRHSWRPLWLRRPLCAGRHASARRGDGGGRPVCADALVCARRRTPFRRGRKCGGDGRRRVLVQQCRTRCPCGGCPRTGARRALPCGRRRRHVLRRRT